MSYHIKTQDAAKGKWRGILLEAGVPENCLTGKHASCPMCGGADRFRFDNKEGRGTYICSKCGAGDGMKLVMDVMQRPFYEAASLIDRLLGNLKPGTEDSVPVEVSDEDRRAFLRELYRSSSPVVAGDLADVYLTSRGVGEMVYPEALRFSPAIRDGEGGVRPCMLALVGVPGAPRFASIHRTFLRGDGKAKAEIAAPRKLAPGSIPPGACVQLAEYVPGGPLGIAEGIETALSASALHRMPVWAALNTSILAKWSPPEGCSDVVVFADHDASFAGQAAAFTLAHRLAAKNVGVEVMLPDRVGEDWNDVLTKQHRN